MLLPTKLFVFLHEIHSTNGSNKDKGVYTIVAEASGTGAKKWGKLKSGAGWISLDYTEKV